jgi:rubrerythrin
MSSYRVALSRRQAIGAALCAGGSALGAILLGEGPGAAESRPSARGDVEILNFALKLEATQAAFYAAAVARGALSGELGRFATIVAAHEREHEQAVRQALGPEAERPPRFAFGDAVADPDAFTRAARNLEDLGVAAYTTYAPSLTRPALTTALRIVAVESRHASWIRDISGVLPAPYAAEPRKSAASVIAALDETRFIR